LSNTIISFYPLSQKSHLIKPLNLILLSQEISVYRTVAFFLIRQKIAGLRQQVLGIEPFQRKSLGLSSFPKSSGLLCFPIVQGGFSRQFCICTFVFKDREMDNQQQEFVLQEERNKLLL
jgi:hypothetical protein